MLHCSRGQVEPFVPLLWMVLLLLAVLAGAILLLFLNQRNFQRVDYSALINEEEHQRRLNTRLAYVEQLIARLLDLEQQRGGELNRLVERARIDLETQVQQARQQITTELLSRPAQLDFVLLRNAGAPTEPVAPAPPRVLTTARQRRIAEMLEEGYDAREVAQMLGISCHEVELVSSLTFGAKIA